MSTTNSLSILLPDLVSSANLLSEITFKPVKWQRAFATVFLPVPGDPVMPIRSCLILSSFALRTNSTFLEENNRLILVITNSHIWNYHCGNENRLFPAYSAQ